MSRRYHSCFPLIVTWCLNHDILLEYESHWLIFLTWGMIMTTALQFSVYDMCHCYNNLNSTHTLNMIVYFCPFGLQFELLQQTQMRWPSWFQDLESYQPRVVVYRSFSWRRSFDAHSHIPNWPNHYIKPHAVQCMGHSWHWWLWLLRVRERSQLRWARRIQLEAGL